MSDKGQQGDGEQLFATDDSDAVAGESTTEDQNTESEGEEIKELDLQEAKKDLSKAEIERQKQVDVWTKRVQNGEAALESLPSNLQWLKPLVEKRLNVQATVPDIEKLVEQKLAEKEDKAKFTSLKETLKYAKLTASQRMELETEYKDFRSDGLSQAKSLEKAMRIAGVEFQRETAPEELHQAMRLPKSGQKVRGNSDDVLDNPEAYKKLPEAERLKKLEETRKKGKL